MNLADLKDTWSPLRNNRMNHGHEQGFVANSPFGLLASPLSNIELMSPESTLSFSLSSPPPNNIGKAEVPQSDISPSIFSPDDNVGRYLRMEKDHGHFNTFHLFEDPHYIASPQVDENLKFNIPRGGYNKAVALVNQESTGLEFSKMKVERRDEIMIPTFLPTTQDSLSSSGLKISTTKIRKGKNFTIVPELPTQSPNNDFARRLSLESTADANLEVRSLRITQEHRDISKTNQSMVLKKAATVPQISSATKSTPTRVTCNCKKSRCLKLYCDCFAILKYCDSSFCNCVMCCNNADNEDKRTEAIKLTKEKNNLAFQTKISDKEQHVTGCHCKNSHCLKKYCECFTGGALCGVNCKCQSCKNFDGSIDLMKAREASPKAETLSGKKRKESPSGINWIEENSPSNNSKSELKPPTVKASSYSLRTSTKESQMEESFHDSGIDSYMPKSLESSAKKRKVKFATTPIVYPFFGKGHPDMPKIIALKILDFSSGKEIYTMSQVNSLWNKAAMDDALWE